MSYNYDEIAKNLDNVCSAHDLGGFYCMISPWMEAIKKLKDTLTFGEVNLKGITLSLSLEDMEQLALEFYGELSLDFKDKIEKVLNDKTTITHSAQPTDKGGKMAVGVDSRKDGLTVTDYVEIDLHPKNTLEGLVSVAHEFGHVLSERVQNKMRPKTDCVGEIETMFFEQIFIDWLYDKGKISEEDYFNLKQSRENNLFNEIQQLLDENKIITKLGTPISAEKLQKWDEELTQKGDFGERRHFVKAIENMIKDPNSLGEYKFRYVFGEIVARAMYNDYQIEPQKTLKNLKSFLDHSAVYDFGMKKTWQTGKCRENSQINKDEIKKCMSTLLGESYNEKINDIISAQNCISETHIN